MWHGEKKKLLCLVDIIDVFIYFLRKATTIWHATFPLVLKKIQIIQNYIKKGSTGFVYYTTVQTTLAPEPKPF